MNRHPAPFTRGVVRYYLAQLRRVLRGPSRWSTFALAALLHAAGHALAALAAGGVAIALAGMWAMRDGRSSLAGDREYLATHAVSVAVAALAVLLVKGTAGVYATYVQGSVAGEVASELRVEVLGALLTVQRTRRSRHQDQGEPTPLAGPSPVSPAGGVSALTDRVREVASGLEHGLLGGLRAVAQLVPLGVLLVALSPRLAAASAVVLGGFGALLGRIRSGYRRATARAAGEQVRLLEAADESVRHADLWMTYGAEAKARARVRGLGDALARGSARLQARAAALSAGNEVLGAAALVVAIAASRAGWLGGSADGASLIAFAVAFFLAYRPLRDLGEARLALARADVAYRELEQLIASSPALEGVPTRRDWRPGALELRGVRLAHGLCEPVSMRAEAGALVAIVGPTGIGKTTLLRTLLGLEAAAGGQVLYDGVPLGDAPAGPATRPFAWVPQDAPLLADTLEDNVRLGADLADPQAALAALGAAALAAELAGMRLGAGGRAVSGGERQWIALARAIATRQPVLLLDEPTSGLDAEAQRRVLTAIARLRGQRTVLLVTHRSEPLAIADVVVRLEAA